MSADQTVPLDTYDPNWEERWDLAHAGYKRAVVASDHAFLQDPVSASHAKRLAEIERWGKRMREAFIAQFPTVEAYRDWRLIWFANSLPWPWITIPRMPNGLPKRDVSRRLEEARQALLENGHPNPGGPSPEQIRQFQAILSAPPPGRSISSDRMSNGAGEEEHCPPPALSLINRLIRALFRFADAR